MTIFNKKNSETRPESKISLFINFKKFFDMSKFTQNKPVLKRNGIKNSLPC